MEKPRLYILSGPRQGLQISLEVTPFTLGRGAGNNLFLPDPTVSGRHARIVAHIGLYWLEDLGSTNGTFLTLPGGTEYRIPPHEPALLVEGVQVRLGEKTIFRVEGVVVTSQNEATRQTLLCLQECLSDCRRRMEGLSPQQREAYQQAIRDLEQRLEQARDEAELTRLAAEAIQELSFTLMDDPDLLQTLTQTYHGFLPPLPEDLPDPDSPLRVNSLRNLFISDIRRLCGFQKGDEENG